MSTKRNTGYTMDAALYYNVEARPEIGVPWFLATSVLYYRPELVGEAAPLSVISDEAFDWLAKFLLEHWDAIQTHEHARYLCKDDLKCGSGYALPWDKLPARLIGGARGMAATWRAKSEQQKTPAPRASKRSRSASAKTAGRNSRRSAPIKDAAP